MKRGKVYGPGYTGTQPTVAEHTMLVKKIMKHLHGKGPELQGAALCDLLAMFIAGHHPSLREFALNHFVNTVRALVPVNEAALFEHHGGKPEDWDDPPPAKKGN